MIAALITAVQILGTWQYAGFRYMDKDYPNPNPELELRFTFNDKGQSVLTYRRGNDGEYCERLATYTFDGKMLYQKVIWVNPKNTAGCGRDLDMQMGRESTTQVSLWGQQLAFHLELDGIELLYLLDPVPAGSIDSASGRAMGRIVSEVPLEKAILQGASWHLDSNKNQYGSQSVDVQF